MIGFKPVSYFHIFFVNFYDFIRALILNSTRLVRIITAVYFPSLFTFDMIIDRRILSDHFKIHITLSINIKPIYSYDKFIHTLFISIQYL